MKISWCNLQLLSCSFFFHTGATALTKSYFGVGFRHQFMQVTLCLGTEHSLMFCTHTPLGSDPSCNALNEVGVRCIGMFPIIFSDGMNTMLSFLNLLCSSLKCMHPWWCSIVWWRKQVPGHCGSMLLWSLGHRVWSVLLLDTHQQHYCNCCLQAVGFLKLRLVADFVQLPNVYSL